MLWPSLVQALRLAPRPQSCSKTCAVSALGLQPQHLPLPQVSPAKAVAVRRRRRCQVRRGSAMMARLDYLRCDRYLDCRC